MSNTNNTINHVQETFAGGITVTYKRLPSGTCYHAETPDHIVDILETLMQNRKKVRVIFGDVLTGRSWCDEWDVVGHIGRSTGSIKIPLLVPPGEDGGCGLLDHCIIRIDTAKKTLYQHENFHIGEVVLKPCLIEGLPWEVCINQEAVARFIKKQTAKQFIAFMQGNRFLPVNYEVEYA